jgi:primosomal protein N' (replication factor Y)
MAVTIARVALPVAAVQLFDYWVPAGLVLHAGSIVRVRLGRRRVVGVVVDLVEATPVAPEKLVPIGEVVALPPLPDDVRELAQFVASYYQAPPGLALALATPPAGASATRTRAAVRGLALTDEGRATLPAALARAPAARALLERLLPERATLEPDAIVALAPHLRRVLARWQRDGLVTTRTPRPGAQGDLRLNDAQMQAVASLGAARGRFAPFLLQGVTGSGKTEVYLAAAAAVVAAGGQALLLVPEINLTPQLVARVAAALPTARTVTLHSALPDGERRAHWEQAARGEADLVLGTRLAVFAALPRLALIVVDEEHDGSYKQHDGVRYHARDAAVWRAHRLGIPVVLGSATPSLESYAHARAGRYERLLLERRADPRAAPPSIRLVPAREAGRDNGLVPALVTAIAACLARGEQSLVFVNRRGFAPSLKCAACTWEAGCPRCSARLTTHRAPVALVCHHCGHRERLPRACPACGNVDLLPLGHGTQRLEQGLAAAFPGARIARVDRDTTRRRHAFADLRARMTGNELDVLVGTQMLAKGHDFPRLTLVGVLGADNALYSADFRATERLAALLMQVAGRAGRAELPGEVIVQTDFPDHPLYRALVRHDYDAFALDLLAEREACGLPPFSHLALVSAEAHRREDVDRALDGLHAQAVASCRASGLAVDVFAPVVAPLARRAGYERSQMLLRSAQRAELQRLLAAIAHHVAAAPQRRVRLAIDVDPAALA